jgi:hypothetical protein
MIKYFSEQKIIARAKNVDRAAWHYVLIKLKKIEKYKQMNKSWTRKSENRCKKEFESKTISRWNVR